MSLTYEPSLELLPFRHPSMSLKYEPSLEPLHIRGSLPPYHPPTRNPKPWPPSSTISVRGLSCDVSHRAMGYDAHSNGVGHTRTVLDTLLTRRLTITARVAHTGAVLDTPADAILNRYPQPMTPPAWHDVHAHLPPHGGGISTHTRTVLDTLRTHWIGAGHTC